MNNGKPVVLVLEDSTIILVFTDVQMPGRWMALSYLITSGADGRL